MTVNELYRKMNRRFPVSLSCEWDNDGLMCTPDGSAEVGSVLLSLDVTEPVVDYAIERKFDLIVSHHPLLFHPLRSVTDGTGAGRKIIKLLESNISVFSFHTRADAAEGGVNDILASLIGLSDAEPFGEGGMGRVGYLPSPLSLEEFAETVRDALGCPYLSVSDGLNKVHRVALLGGDGKDFVDAAAAAGADTFLTGALSYNLMEEADEREINLIEAGHYYTEAPLLEEFRRVINSAADNLYIETADSNAVRTL